MLHLKQLHGRGKESLWKHGTYQIQGYEKGEQGTPHIQGYIEFENSVSLSTLKKINKRIHWEKEEEAKKQPFSIVKKKATGRRRGFKNPG